MKRTLAEKFGEKKRGNMKSKLIALVLVMTLLKGVPDSYAAECHLTFRTIRYNPTMPYSHVDQALESIPVIFPKHKILLQRRMSTVGAIDYAIIIFQEDANTNIVTIEGAAVRRPDAWTFQVKCMKDAALECLAVTLEKVAALGASKQ